MEIHPWRKKLRDKSRMSSTLINSYLSNSTITYYHSFDSGSGGGSRHTKLDKILKRDKIELILLERRINFLFTEWLK